MYTRIGKMRVPGRPGEVELSAGCFCHGELMKVTVKEVQLLMYESGAKAQDAFPDLSDEEKEFIISGMCGKGWKEMCDELMEEEKE